MRKPRQTDSERAKALREEHANIVREKIQTSALVKVLEDYSLGRGKTKMTATRLRAIETLLDKTLPNLASVKHEVDAKQVVFMIDTTFNEPDSVPTTG
jgi:hypothetical protein